MVGDNASKLGGYGIDFIAGFASPAAAVAYVITGHRATCLESFFMRQKKNPAMYEGGRCACVATIAAAVYFG